MGNPCIYESGCSTVYRTLIRPESKALLVGFGLQGQGSKLKSRRLSLCKTAVHTEYEPQSIPDRGAGGGSFPEEAAGSEVPKLEVCMLHYARPSRVTVKQRPYVITQCLCISLQTVLVTQVHPDVLLPGVLSNFLGTQ